ncbi:MAG: DNA-directed RNA polymerase subunit beta [Spirochaetia bacterium]|nr:DNA-directed RNA polymerase subunit beta [Spirochaetia bacterium]
MLDRKKAIKRQYVGRDYHEVMEVPNLIDIQLSSYEKFLQLDKIRKGEPLENQGLEEVFQSIFPIESPNGDMVLEYLNYTLDESSIKLDEYECKLKGVSYSVPLKALISLNFHETGELRRKMIYIGDIPLMTDRGTFIINGAERVVVSQIHRSPGVVFSDDKGVFSSRIIPYRGSWLEFEIDKKKDLIYTKIDRKKRILGTMFLRALGYDSRESIIELFYETKKVQISESSEENENLVGKVLAKAIYADEEVDGKKKKLFRAGDKVQIHDLDELRHSGITEIEIIDEDNPLSLHSKMILNCFDIEDVKYVKDDSEGDEPTKYDALAAVYSVLLPGEPITMENAEKDLKAMFFTFRRYDLGKVGRYKLNKKFYIAEKTDESAIVSGDADDAERILSAEELQAKELEELQKARDKRLFGDDLIFDSDKPEDAQVLRKSDIIKTMTYLIKVFIEEAPKDDIDHLGNRRVRSVGELLANQLKIAFTRMERIAKERMCLKETDTLKPQDLISIKPIGAAIKEFFGSSQLSQFMDQVNPLSELTHKRRLNALGPGGLSRDRAGFEVRDVHYTHYGRMCPIETPEGPNIGLIVSLSNYTRVNEYGFLETPYREVVNGKATKKVRYMDAMDEDKYVIAQANASLDKNGKFLDDQVSVRKQGDYTAVAPEKIQYMDVSPKQVISVSASLVPFIEHDDANRALMGCNMMRQAVPLLFPESPILGTGMEGRTAYDSGVVIKAKRDGKVTFVSSTRIEITPDEEPDKIDSYRLLKYQRTNQDTCFTQRPVVSLNQKVTKGDVIADGPATDHGELALGRNILVCFIPWNGYNYEDAILISEKVVKEDTFTSIHIKELTVEVRETKLGSEKLTRDIPNTSEKALEQLDEEGIVRIGAKVNSNDILVGKVTPKSETETTPEFRLLNSIFGEKAKEVRDTSLKVPHGTSGVVIDVQRLKRTEGDDLSPGVDEVVKILIATKRKLREGDKMAGRHGNKGVVARVLPEEDMPYLADGTPMDICLNPLGVPSRMNLGQLMEVSLGLAGYALGEKYAVPVFQSATNEMISEKLKEAGLPENSKAILYDGLTGEPFENPLMIGCVYMLKLHHLVDDKMHARSTGPYSLVTQQPLGGKAQFGGQRLGEMEVWALEAYGAANTLQEFLTIKSDDMNGRTKTYENIVKGEPTTQAGVPESFNVLVQELRGLGLDMTIWDARGRQIPLTEKDEESLKRQGTNF